jgi:hypothetical protein
MTTKTPKVSHVESTCPVTPENSSPITESASERPKREKKLRNCRCPAYKWPHRVRGGLCRFPDPPAAVCETKAGTHSGDGARTDNSAIRARLLGWYNLHPIRDRAKVKRFLPKLYAAYCRRRGWPYACRWMGGYVPAMLVTEHGAPGLGGKRPRHPPPST